MRNEGAYPYQFTRVHVKSLFLAGNRPPSESAIQQSLTLADLQRTGDPPGYGQDLDT